VANIWDVLELLYNLIMVMVVLIMVFFTWPIILIILPFIGLYAIWFFYLKRRRRR
jgi:hypothetical protein